MRAFWADRLSLTGAAVSSRSCPSWVFVLGDWSVGAKAKRPLESVDAYCIEARCPQPVWQTVRIYWHSCVEDMVEAKAPPAGRIEANEDPTRLENPGDLSKQSILQGRQGHVMQHREGSRAGEEPLGDRQMSGVALHDRDVRVHEPLAQPPGKRLVYLDRGEPGDSSSQQVGRQPGSGSDLEHVGPEIDSRKNPGDHVLSKATSPATRRAEPTVVTIHHTRPYRPANIAQRCIFATKAPRRPGNGRCRRFRARVRCTPTIKLAVRSRSSGVAPRDKQ